MRILLVGEYSRFHNSLKEGLQKLQHDVTLIGRADSFKNYPIDISLEATFFQKKIHNIFHMIRKKKTIHKYFPYAFLT